MHRHSKRRNSECFNKKQYNRYNIPGAIKILYLFPVLNFTIFSMKRVNLTPRSHVSVSYIARSKKVQDPGSDTFSVSLQPAISTPYFYKYNILFY